MGQHHPFGQAGGAAGVHDPEEIFRVHAVVGWIRRRRLLQQAGVGGAGASHFSHPDEVLDAFQSLQDRGQVGEEFGFGDHRPHSGVGDNGSQFPGVEHVVEGHEDETAASQGEHELEGLVGVVKQQTDAVAALQPQAAEAGCQALHLVLETGVGQARMAIDQRFRGRRAPRALFQQVADGHQRSTSLPTRGARFALP